MKTLELRKTYDEFKEILNTKAGYIRMMWCEDDACEAKIKEETVLHQDVSKKMKNHLEMFVQFVVKPAKKLFTLQKLINLYKGVIVKIALFILSSFYRENLHKCV